jgi:hypothetical protein
MFFGLPDPHPDQLVTSTDMNADPAPFLISVERSEIMVAN